MTFKTYLVGGAVRDELLGLLSKDLDFVVLAPSFDSMRDDLLAQGCKIFVEKPEFLTIRCKHPKLGCVDFAVARKDGIYTDGRRPDHTEIADSLIEDLARRDFTCNAIAKDITTGEIVDPFDGQAAIRNYSLRCVGSARERLSEDKLRAFRAIRFAITKHFTISFELAQAICDLLPTDFDSVSTHRVWEEIYKCAVVDIKRLFNLIYHDFTILGKIVDERGIWFEPTTRTK